MSEHHRAPTRWRDPTGDAPDHIRELLDAARPSRGLDPVADAELRRFVHGLSAAPAAPWWHAAPLGKVALAVALTAAGASALRARTHADRGSVAHVRTAPRAPVLSPPRTERHPEEQATVAAPQQPLAAPHDGVPVDEHSVTPRWGVTPTTAPRAVHLAHAIAPEADEAEVLERCRRDICDGQIDRALATLDAQARTHSATALSQERGYLRVRAMFVGRRAGFRAEAERFLRAYASGLYASRVEEMLRRGEP